MSKLLLGIKKGTTHVSGMSSEGYTSNSIDATLIDIVMSGTEDEIRKFVQEKREKRKELIKLSNEIERLEDREDWGAIDPVQNKYDKIVAQTSGVNYDKLIMIDGIEL